MARRTEQKRAARPRLYRDGAAGTRRRRRRWMRARRIICCMCCAPRRAIACRLFNGRDGEWLAESPAAGKRGVTLTCLKQTQPQAEVPDLWLVFAPVKKTPSDYLAQKATELGVACCSRSSPAAPSSTPHQRRAHARQRRRGGGTIGPAERARDPRGRALEKLLAAWPSERRLFFCDEGGEAPAAGRSGARSRSGPAAILTGPEGGFDPAERDTVARACLSSRRSRSARASCAPTPPRWRRWRSGNPSPAIGVQTSGTSAR